MFTRRIYHAQHTQSRKRKKSQVSRQAKRQRRAQTLQRITEYPHINQMCFDLLEFQDLVCLSLVNKGMHRSLWSHVSRLYCPSPTYLGKTRVYSKLRSIIFENASSPQTETQVLSLSADQFPNLQDLQISQPAQFSFQRNPRIALLSLQLTLMYDVPCLVELSSLVSLRLKQCCSQITYPPNLCSLTLFQCSLSSFHDISCLPHLTYLEMDRCIYTGNAQNFIIEHKELTELRIIGSIQPPEITWRYVPSLRHLALQNIPCIVYTPESSFEGLESLDLFLSRDKLDDMCRQLRLSPRSDLERVRFKANEIFFDGLRFPSLRELQVEAQNVDLCNLKATTVCVSSESLLTSCRIRDAPILTALHIYSYLSTSTLCEIDDSVWGQLRACTLFLSSNRSLPPSSQMLEAIFPKFVHLQELNLSFQMLLTPHQWHQSLQLLQRLPLVELTLGNINISGRMGWPGIAHLPIQKLVLDGIRSYSFTIQYLQIKPFFISASKESVCTNVKGVRSKSTS